MLAPALRLPVLAALRAGATPGAFFAVPRLAAGALAGFVATFFFAGFGADFAAGFALSRTGVRAALLAVLRVATRVLEACVMSPDSPVNRRIIHSMGCGQRPIHGSGRGIAAAEVYIGTGPRPGSGK